MCFSSGQLRQEEHDLNPESVGSRIHIVALGLHAEIAMMILASSAVRRRTE